MHITKTAIPDVLVVKPRRIADARGYFMETYNARALAAAGVDCVFAQDNQSLSVARGTVRGLHFQTHPSAQAKLVRVLRGAILDVAVDIRRGSPSYGRHVAVELSAASDLQLFIPIGFAHGFCTLEDHTEVAYKVSHDYAREHDAGIAWDDPDLGIAWPIAAADAVVSDKDRALPRLAAAPAYFTYG